VAQREKRGAKFRNPDPVQTLAELSAAVADLEIDLARTGQDCLPLQPDLIRNWRANLSSKDQRWLWTISDFHDRERLPRVPYWTRDPDGVWALEITRIQWGIGHDDWHMTVAAGGEIVVTRTHVPLNKKIRARISRSWTSNRTGIPHVDAATTTLIAGIMQPVAQHTPREMVELVKSTTTAFDRRFLRANQIAR
jgi:hypothetical protein